MNRLFNTSLQFFCSNLSKKSRVFRFKHGSFILPHPEKEYKGGEDALLASDNILIVADGVGGWADSGVDPALYSKKLVSIMEELVKKDKKYIDNPKLLVNQAVSMNKQTGSTTVCILTLHPDTGLVRTYYLGDSVYAVAKVQEKTMEVAPDQQVQFNFPYQVGTNGHSPLEGVYKQFTVGEQTGQISQKDYIIVGTDGLWDNVQIPLIFTIGTGQIKEVNIDTLDQRAQVMALTSRALYSQQQPYESPFHLKAKQEGLRYPKQGKPDDTSVIVAQIVQEEL